MFSCNFCIKSRLKWIDIAAEKPCYSKQIIGDDDIETILNDDDFSDIAGDGEEEQEDFDTDKRLADKIYFPVEVDIEKK